MWQNLSWFNNLHCVCVQLAGLAAVEEAGAGGGGVVGVWL